MMGVSSGCGLCPWSCSGKVGAYVSDSNSNSGSSCTVASAYSAYSVPQLLHAVCGSYIHVDTINHTNFLPPMRNYFNSYSNCPRDETIGYLQLCVHVCACEHWSFSLVLCE